MRWIAAPTIALAIAASTVQAQVRADSAGIERAMAAYAVSHLSLEGVVAFDRGAAGRDSSDRAAADVQALAGVFRAAKVGRTRDFYSCAGKSPSTCRVTGADAIVSMSRPEIAGDTAFVTVRVIRPIETARMKVQRKEDRYRLLRAPNGSWTVEGWVSGSMS